MQIAINVDKVVLDSEEKKKLFPFSYLAKSQFQLQINYFGDIECILKHIQKYFPIYSYFT